MKTETSEAVLSALERSVDPATSLLDRAASVIGLYRDHDSPSYELQAQSNTYQDSRKFRHQWVLKWLIKQLSQANKSSAALSDPRVSLVLEPRTWSLFGHLVYIIPRDAARTILIERNFCQHLNTCLVEVLKQLVECEPSVDAARCNDVDGNRLSKRRRLSIDGSLKSTQTLELLSHLSRVIGRVAEVLCGNEQDDAAMVILAAANWIPNIDTAAQFIGRIMGFTKKRLEFANAADRSNQRMPRNALLNTLALWLRLWKSFTSHHVGKTRQQVHKAFNQHILLPALELLDGIGNHKHTVYSELDREIALVCILPARSEFLKQMKKMAKLPKQDIAIDQVPQCLSTIINIWGPGVRDLQYRGRQASRLLSIAGRLVPRSNVAERRRESTWLEALFACLCEVVDPPPPETSGTSKDSEAKQIDVDGKQTQAHAGACLDSDLLSTLEREVTRPSSQFWQYQLQRRVLSDSCASNFQILGRAAKVNPSLFVPNATPQGQTNLEAILEQAPKDDIHDPEGIVFVQHVLQPIVLEIAKSRQLESLLALLEKKLIGSFYNRNQALEQRNAESQALFRWDRPDILDQLTHACQQYPQSSLLKDQIQDLQSKLADLPTAIGSAYDTFARLTIFVSLFPAIKHDPTASAQLLSNLQRLRAHTIAAVQRSSDFTGQKWQLWRLLYFLTTYEAESNQNTVQIAEQLQYPFISLSDTQRLTSTISHQPNKLLQCYWSFCVATYSISMNDPDKQRSAEDCLHVLAEITSKYASDCCSQVIGLEIGEWDGSVEGMDNLPTLLSACLAALAAAPSRWFNSYPASTHKLLIACAVLSLSNDTSSEAVAVQNRPTLQHVCEALLDTAMTTSNGEALDIYLEALDSFDSPAIIRTFSPLIACLQITDTKPDQLQRLFKLVKEKFGSAPAFATSTGYLDYLGMLSTALGRSTMSGSESEYMSSVVESLRQSTIDADATQVLEASNHMQRIAVSLAKHVSSSSDRKTVRHICKSMRKKLAKQAVGNPENLFGSYEDLLMLGLLGLSTEFQSENAGDKLSEEWAQLRTQFEEFFTKIAHSHVLQDLNAVAVIKAWKLVDTVVRLKAASNGGITSDQDLLKVGTALQRSIVKLLASPDSTKYNALLLLVKGALERALPPLQESLGVFAKSLICSEDGSAMKQKHALLIASTVQTHLLQSPDLEAGPTTIAFANDLGCDEQTQGQRDFTVMCLKIAGVRRITTQQIKDSPEILRDLGQVASLRCESMSNSTVALISRIELSKSVLQKHPTIINQDIMDKTITSIATIASSACKTVLSSETKDLEPHHIFDRLCNILLLVLTRYRRRLNDRHHLLIRALQNILNCLFYPGTNTQIATSRNTHPAKAAFFTSLPHWLNPPTHTSALTLPPSSASKYSRVLQLLAEPSASAARNTLKRPHTDDTRNLNLTDPTKQLKLLTSQYTQYLVQTFCRASLCGYIAPGVREKLLPGMYAVVGTMDIELMRGMNSAMDADMRAIWKDLYSDWTKFGKWNQR